jgi:hypothetical protein
MINKLKSSATLWAVIGGFILGAANLIWGNDTTASTIASAIIVVAPSVSYIISKFVLRIRMADIDADGKISLEELIFAIKEAVDDTSDEGKKVLGFVCDAISKLDIQNEEQVDE